MVTGIKSLERQCRVLLHSQQELAAFCKSICSLKFALLALFYPFISQYALAQVTLLVERGASTYQQAANGFRAELGAIVDIDEIEINESGRLPQKAFEVLAKSPPRLIVAIGTRAAQESSARFPNLATLYCLALHPAPNELARGNIGGVTLDVAIPQQIDNARKILPNLKNIGVVYDEMTSGSLVRSLQKQLTTEVHLVARSARTPQDAEREIETLLGTVLGPDDAFLLLWDSVVANPANFRLLVNLSLKNKVPLIAPARPFVEAGALISTGVNYEQAGRQAATMARQIILGTARPLDFGSVSANHLTVTINAAVAGQLGLNIPANLRADILGAFRIRAIP